MYVCLNCNSSISEPIQKRGGSRLLEIFLWLSFGFIVLSASSLDIKDPEFPISFILISAIYYSHYCSTNKKNFCPFCNKESVATYICSQCNSLIAKPKKQKRGSFGLSLILYCLAIIPGIIYSIYRRKNMIPLCPYCNKDTLIKLTTPVGKKLLNELINSGYIKIHSKYTTTS